MLTFEQQTKKLLSKRQAVLDRKVSDKAEIEKINAKLNAIQLAKIRDTLGCDEQETFEVSLTPEQLAKQLKQESTARAIWIKLKDSDESNLSGRLRSLTRSLTPMRIKIFRQQNDSCKRDGACRSAQLYHTQHKEGQIEKAIPSL